MNTQLNTIENNRKTVFVNVNSGEKKVDQRLKASREKRLEEDAFWLLGEDHEQSLNDYGDIQGYMSKHYKYM